MDGIINVYKEKGFTSFDVVAKLRGICHQKKIGHTGTLDPDAEGVLPVCLGTATKVCGLLTDKEKEYEAVLLLGKETDTQDVGGKVLRECNVSCSKEQVREAAASFLGEYSQVPPMYSALKVNGQKLCDLARAGVEVERKPRVVQIFDLSIGQIELPRVKLKVHCSKGTYIRTLCYDIGRKLGCGGCMESLVRTRSGMFTCADAMKLSDIEELAGQGKLDKYLVPVDQLFLDVPAAKVHANFQKMLVNGCRMPKRSFDMEMDIADGYPSKLRVYYGEEFFGIYMRDDVHGDYKPQKIFWRENKNRQ